MPILVTRLTLIFLCWTLEKMNKYGISTLLASLPLLVNILDMNAFLVIVVLVWWYLLSVTCIILVTGWSRLHKRLLLVFACCKVCVLVSHKINLCYLGVICYQVDVPGSHLWTLHLLCKLPDLAYWEHVQVYVAIIYCLGDKLFIFQEEPKMSLWSIFAVSGGYLAKATWVWTALYHSTTELFPCQNLVRRSNLALTSFHCGLHNSSNIS